MISDQWLYIDHKSELITSGADAAG